MNDQIRRSISNGSTWLRLVFMVLYGIVLCVLLHVVALVAVAQFLCKLFTGSVFVRLTAFGHSLGLFLFQIVAYLIYRTERRPFPFAPWPAGPTNAQRRQSDRPGAPPPQPAAPSEERRGGMRIVRTPGRQAQDDKPKT